MKQRNTDKEPIKVERTGEIRKQISNCMLGWSETLYSSILTNSGQEKDAGYFIDFGKNHKIG